MLGELAGIRLPPLPEPQDGLEIDPTRYVGTYDRLSARQIVEERDGKLWLTNVERRALVPSDPPQPAMELRPVTGDTFCFTPPESRFKSYVTFLEFGEDGRAGYLHSGRTAPRVR